MKKGKIFFHPIEGSGPLTISWSSQPKGDAIEATKGSGVGFFSDKGDLLCVIFDDVQAIDDHQTLEFERDYVEIKITKGRVSHTVTQRMSVPRLLKKRKRKQTV